MRGVAATLASSVVFAAAAGATAAAPAAAHGAAVFRVGVAVANIDPTYPVYLGGYGAGPAGGTIARHVDPLTGKHEHLTVRAIAIARAGHVVELATVDTQGYMAGYDEGPYGLTPIRQNVARWLAGHGVAGADESNIIVSSLHEHAVPTLFGVWAPMSHQVRYLAEVARTLTRVLERAYENARPATLSYGTVNAPWLGGGNTPEGNEFEGWPRDGFLLALQARAVDTGRTIATYVSEPAYPNLVYGAADLVQPGKVTKTLISADFPHYTREFLERRYGGVAIVASSTLSNQASPEQADVAASPDLPRVDGLRQTRAFDDIILMGHAVANLTMDALAHAAVVTDPSLASAEQHVVSPADNAALVALNASCEAGPAGEQAISAVTAGSIYPACRSMVPPYAYGAALGTWVTAVRVGRLVFVSEPGEFAAPIHWTWQNSIGDADAVAVIGAAQDFLGYEYPMYVTPFTLLGGDELIFDPGVALGDQVELAGKQDAAALGFPVNWATTGEATVTDNDYAQMSRPGVALLASNDEAGVGTTLTFEASSQVPRLRMTCTNPALVVAPPACPLPQDAMGPFYWDFGDGTTLTTPVAAAARAYFSPYVHHRYARPGRYKVTVHAYDANGQPATPATMWISVGR